MPRTLGAGLIDDEGMQWKLGCKTLYPADAAVTLTEGTPNLITTLGAGTPNIAELSVAASELSGFNVDTADEIYWLLDIAGDAWDIDLTRDIHCEIVFDAGTNGSRSGIIWKSYCKGIAANQAISDALVSPDGTITFPTITQPGVASALLKTARKPFLVPNVFATDEALAVVVELNSRGTAAADELKFMYARLWYTLSACHASGRAQLT